MNKIETMLHILILCIPVTPQGEAEGCVGIQGQQEGQIDSPLL